MTTRPLATIVAEHACGCDICARVSSVCPATASSYAQEILRLEAENARVKAEKDGAYHERNQVVAALARCFHSGVALTSIEGWEPGWEGCVYIDLPTGQASWHYHESESHLFDGLPPYSKPWDGHTTEEKYLRLAATYDFDDSERCPGCGAPPGEECSVQCRIEEEEYREER